RGKNNRAANADYSSPVYGGGVERRSRETEGAKAGDSISLRKVAVVLSAVLLATGASAAAQETSDLNKDEIVVSATRTPRPLNETGSSVTIIDAVEIEARQYQFAADALADAAGVALARNGAFGGQAALRIRGEASGRTLVMIDGVVVNDPSAPGGGFNFANLDVADIERIEILRGPQSILYGSEAIGGVVSIETRRGAGAPEATLFLEGGSFATFRGGTGLAGGSEQTDYRVSVFGTTTDGISKADGGAERDGFDSIAASANFGARLADPLRVEGFFRYGRSETEFDGFPPPNFTLADTNDKDEVEEIVASGRAILTLFDDRLENIATVGFSDIDRENFSGDITTFAADGSRLSAEYLGRFRFTDRLAGIVGAETEETKIDTGDIDDDVTVDSVFGLVELKPVDALTVTAGTRRDDHETFGAVTTARVTAALNLDEAGVILRASWGEGFAAPSLFQLNFVCCGGAAPNRALEPEDSEGWDAGVEKRFLDGDLSLRATYFHQETENLIDFDFLTGAFTNIDRTLRKGVETEFAWRISTALRFDLAYAYVNGREIPGGARLLRQPRHSLAAHAGWKPTHKLSLNATLRYNGEESDIGGAIPAFTRVDLRGAYAVNERLEFFVRIENAFDEDYQDVLGFGEPGASAFGGLRARL
ncbi:MAG: TonB-dependent receptor plug domain-containing protein, partial [Parvularculaceae bacterium]